MNKPLVVAIIVSDEREVLRDYSSTHVSFGPAPNALLQGLAQTPECHIHILSCLQQPVGSPPRLAPNILFHTLTVRQWGWLRTGYSGCLSAIRKKLRELNPD